MARLQLNSSLIQFLEGIISLFLSRMLTLYFLLPLASFAVGFFVFAFARCFAAGLTVAALVAAFFAAAFFAAARLSSSASSAGLATFSFFGRGPIEGFALSA